MDLRRQRVDNEWTILRQMAGANPACLEIKEQRPDEFLLVLKQSQRQFALVEKSKMARLNWSRNTKCGLPLPVFSPRCRLKRT